MIEEKEWEEEAQIPLDDLKFNIGMASWRIAQMDIETRREICQEFWKGFSKTEKPKNEDFFFQFNDCRIRCVNGTKCWYIENPGNDYENEYNYYSYIDPERYFYCDACYNTGRCNNNSWKIKIKEC